MSARTLPILLLVSSTFVLFGREREPVDPKVIVEPEKCYIALDYGVKWHLMKDCRSLRRSDNIDLVTINKALEIGEGKKWLDGCGICFKRLDFAIEEGDFANDTEKVAYVKQLLKTHYKKRN